VKSRRQQAENSKGGRLLPADKSQDESDEDKDADNQPD